MRGSRSRSGGHVLGVGGHSGRLCPLSRRPPAATSSLQVARLPCNERSAWVHSFTRVLGALPLWVAVHSVLGAGVWYQGLCRPGGLKRGRGIAASCLLLRECCRGSPLCPGVESSTFCPVFDSLFTSEVFTHPLLPTRSWLGDVPSLGQAGSRAGQSPHQAWVGAFLSVSPVGLDPCLSSLPTAWSTVLSIR